MQIPVSPLSRSTPHFLGQRTQDFKLLYAFAIFSLSKPCSNVLIYAGSNDDIISYEVGIENHFY
jgi:hypothetical protein